MKSDPSPFVEYKQVRQEPGLHRRWFQSPSGDLMVWYDQSGGQVTGMQFCHPENTRERVYTWRPPAGWRQQLVDTGTRQPMMKATPILVDATPIPLDDMQRRVRSGLSGLEAKLAGLVEAALST